MPASPVVDSNRNLTSEWLQALGDIEKISTIKTALDNADGADITTLTDIETLLADMQATIEEAGSLAPNNVLFSIVPFTTNPTVAPGIVHGLGTSAYIAMKADNNQPSILFGISFVLHDNTSWQLNSNPGGSGEGWLTVSVVGADETT